MARCEKQGFTGVTGAHFAELLKAGEAMGVPIAGQSGQATRDGITIAWAYDAAAGTLTVECTDSPFFIPCSVINGRIQSTLGNILAKTDLA